MTEEEIAEYEEKRRIAAAKRKEYMKAYHKTWYEANNDKSRSSSLKYYYKVKAEKDPDHYIKKHIEVIKNLQTLKLH
jgi:hypothetical protein